MEKLQKDCEEYILYSPDSLKYITDPMENILKEKINEYKKIFNVDDYKKIQINYFDDIEKFRTFIYELRGRKVLLPKYCQGTFDNDMVNAYIPADLDPSSPKYFSRLYMASHEIFHIMYKNIILKPLNMNRIVWYDEGMAQFLSGKYSKHLDEDEFTKFFLETKNNTKVIPDLNNLSHGENFENDSYSGYRLSYLAIRYLYETLDRNEFFELMKNENKILEYGTNIINEMFEFYTNKYLNNKHSLGKRKIYSSNKIFNDENFIKDKYKFYIILRNLSSPELELYSDEENYIICRGSKDLPTWIWTKDNFDKSKISEIEELMRVFLTDKEKDKFTCKKELYDLLVQRNFEYINLDDYFEMGFLVCHKTNKPKECDATMSVPTIDDLSVLQKYFYDDHNEMNGVGTITMEEAKIKAQEYLDSGMFYVLRNKDNKIVSMAGYNMVEDQAKINAVYTPVEERKKGYAANLIYLITNDLLDMGLTPLLYTDYNYVPSNKAYINAGYTDEGILINFSCSREKKKGVRL